MKKTLFIITFGLFGLSLYAQGEQNNKDWLIGGTLYFDSYKWDNSNESKTTNQFSFSLNFGKYLTNNFALGIQGSFNFPDEGSTITFGPVLYYDALNWEKVTLSLTGKILYRSFNDTYKWNDTYSAIDANELLLVFAPQFVFNVSKHINLYWEFMQIGYFYTWLTLPNASNLECNTSEFYLSGPFTNPTFGITFKF
jgi:hypothetical protein